nr:PREDICTED: uncharacterized protein LOC109033821 isoform X1 [Bemisia tabaci]XP_018902165.1 PREDICTED: uncharacterized protein LOC109033821 isoform X2 [Bemisia tabaci]
MNGGRRRSMLGTRNLGLQPVKLSIPGSHLGKRPDSSGRKNRPFGTQKSPQKSEQGVVKRLFDEPAKVEKRSPIYTRLSSAAVVKDASPAKINLSKTEFRQKTEAQLSRPTPRGSPRCPLGRSPATKGESSTTCHQDSNKMEISRAATSKFNLLNSSHYSHLNAGKTLKSPKSPILWSNATKFRRHINTEPIKSPEEPQFSSRTMSMLTSTAQKNTKKPASKENENESSFLKLESPHLSAIKIMKPVEKPAACGKSVKNLYPFTCADSSLNDIVKNETITEETVLANKSNDDSFLNNETLCLMDTDQTVKETHDSKEVTLKNASINKTVIATPRKLSIISEETVVKSEPTVLKPDIPDESLTDLMNCVNNLMVNKENFLSQQNSLVQQIKQSQEKFFVQQDEILLKINNIMTKLSHKADRKTTISMNPPRNEIVTSSIAGNGNDEDDELLSEDMNDGNNSLICATKKLKIFDEDSETPRRSARILEKIDSSRNVSDAAKTPDSLKSNCTNYLSTLDTTEMSEFKENSLKTPINQRSSSKANESRSRPYSAKRLSRSAAKSSLKTPSCPRKTIADKSFSKYETPSKRSKKSPAIGRVSMRLSRTPTTIKRNQSSPEQDNTAILMKNLRRSCAFLKTPKNTNRMSIQASNILTPHSMSFVVHDQMKNIFSS